MNHLNLVIYNKKKYFYKNKSYIYIYINNNIIFIKL